MWQLERRWDEHMFKMTCTVAILGSSNPRISLIVAHLVFVGTWGFETLTRLKFGSDTSSWAERCRLISCGDSARQNYSTRSIKVNALRTRTIEQIIVTRCFRSGHKRQHNEAWITSVYRVDLYSHWYSRFDIRDYPNSLSSSWNGAGFRGLLDSDLKEQRPRARAYSWLDKQSLWLASDVAQLENAVLLYAPLEGAS